MAGKDGALPGECKQAPERIGQKAHITARQIGTANTTAGKQGVPGEKERVFAAKLQFR